eukprot:767897-Hanusia_phi.AAC.5
MREIMYTLKLFTTLITEDTIILVSLLIPEVHEALQHQLKLRPEGALEANGGGQDPAVGRGNCDVLHGRVLYLQLRHGVVQFGQVDLVLRQLPPELVVLEDVVLDPLERLVEEVPPPQEEADPGQEEDDVVGPQGGESDIQLPFSQVHDQGVHEGSSKAVDREQRQSVSLLELHHKPVPELQHSPEEGLQESEQ